MADKTGTEWTDATLIVDRGGRRIRVYRRTGEQLDRPGQQLRRAMARAGKRWCRGCVAWRRSEEVGRQGVCRSCANAEYRARYAINPDPIRRQKVARKRGLTVLPEIGREYLTEQFAGSCAYCPSPATSWDHLVPVSAGGLTEPGNMVPACIPCNSSKNNRDLAEWLKRTGRDVSLDVLDVLMLAEVA